MKGLGDSHTNREAWVPEKAPTEGWKRLASTISGFFADMGQDLGVASRASFHIGSHKQHIHTYTHIYGSV